LKSGSLNLLEPSGTVQDYNGTALPSLLLSITCFVPQNEITEERRHLFRAMERLEKMEEIREILQ
jgi:hypothetical protein